MRPLSLALTHAGSVSLSDYQDAFVHYLTKFPTKDSLGTGNPPDVWSSELDSVAAVALDPILATSANLEGGNVSGQRGFAMQNRLRALHAVRAERDSDYVNPYSQPIEYPAPAKRTGTIIRLTP